MLARSFLSPWKSWVGLSCRFCRGLKSTAEGIADTPIATGFSGSVSKSQLYFPWRERPKVRESSWLKQASFDTVKYFFNQHMSVECSLLQEKFIVDGGKTAFLACLNGIFQHRLVNNMCLLHSGQAERSPEYLMKKLAPDEVPYLCDIMETKLAQFYENAVLKHSLGNGCSIGYVLLETHQPIIVNREFLFGDVRRRGALHNPHSVTSDHVGVGYILDGEDASSLSELFASLKKAGRSGFVCVRYWLDIPCHEVFFVKDRKSDTVVQGAQEPRFVVHQILLENSFEYSTSEGSFVRMDDDWSVVDLDQWMGGNKYWAASKKWGE